MRMSSHLYVASVSQLTGELLTETIMHQKTQRNNAPSTTKLAPRSVKISNRQKFNFEKAHYAGQLKRGKRMIKCNKLLYGRILLLWRLKNISTEHTRAIFFRRKVYANVPYSMAPIHIQLLTDQVLRLAQDQSQDKDQIRPRRRLKP